MTTVVLRPGTGFPSTVGVNTTVQALKLSLISAAVPARSTFSVASAARAACSASSLRGRSAGRAGGSGGMHLAGSGHDWFGPHGGEGAQAMAGVATPEPLQLV